MKSPHGPLFDDPSPEKETVEILPQFEETLPYQKHSATSAAAAREARPNAGTLRAIVLGELERRGPRGATDDELQDALGMNPSTQRPRRVELVERGLVRDSGDTRKTKSGRSATVWVATK